MSGTKCRICKSELDGVFLTLSKKSTYASFSEKDIKSFNARLAFECGRKDCTAVICLECIPRLKREKRGGFLVKQELPICPKCKEPFGVSGGRIFISGRFSPGVGTFKEEVGPGKGKMFFFDEQRVDFMVFSGNDIVSRIFSKDIHLPQLCAVCMSIPVYTHPEPGKIILPLCKPCHDLIHHHAIENPTPPLKWAAEDHDTVAMGSMYFINPEYAGLVQDIQKRR